MVRKDRELAMIGHGLNLQEFKEQSVAEYAEATFPANGILLDVDEVSQAAAMATGISLEEAEIYDELLNPDNLIGDVLPPCNGDHYDEKKDTMIPKDLHSYRFFKEVQGNKVHPLKKQLMVNFFRPREKEDYTLTQAEQDALTVDDIVQTPELVLHIGVLNERMVKTKGMLVLASQTLSEFVDSIECPMDLDICWQEVSENPFLEGVDWQSTCRLSSALYLGGDTIYIDTRHPEHVDYSITIKNFLEAHKDSITRGQIPIKTTADICDTRWIDLPEIRLGQPNVFIHQGSCEHVVVVEYARLFHPGDDPRVANYPRQIYRGGPRRGACVCCGEFARWITFNDEEAPSSPCLWCFSCYWLLHYSSGGEPLHDFDAYVYLENVFDRVGWQVAFKKFKATLKDGSAGEGEGEKEGETQAGDKRQSRETTEEQEDGSSLTVL